MSHGDHFDPDEAVRRMNDIEHFDPVECVLCDFEGDDPEEYNRHMAQVHQPAKTSLRNGRASVQTRLEEARKQCRLALGALEATEEFGLCAEVAEAEAKLDDVLDAIEEVETDD